MPLSVFFIDVDDTLYTSNAGIWALICARMEDYMHKEMGIPTEEVPTLRSQLYREYGTTLRGLRAMYGIEPQPYLDYVHNVPLNHHLKPDHKLRAVLESYPQRKIVFTNADERHASRVIQALGLDGIFEQTIDILALTPDCKPMKAAYQTALKLAGDPEPESCLMVDDSVDNLLTARQLGMRTVCIGPATIENCCDAQIPSLLDLPLIVDPSGEWIDS